MRRLAEAALASGLASVVATCCGFARVKLYAMFLGVAGVGVIAQIQNLHNLLAVVAMMGLGLGISREVARARAASESEALENVLGTARLLAAGASLLLVLGVVFLAEPLSSWLLGDPSHAVLLRIAAPALAFASLGRVLFEVLNGHRAYWSTARATMISAVIALVALLPLIHWFGLAGAAAALSVGALAGWIVLVAVLWRTRPELRGVRSRLSAQVARTLLGLGAATLAISTADQVALLIIRARLIHWHGLAGNGWFQGVWGLSQYLLNVAVVFLSSYSVARISEMSRREDVPGELYRGFRMTLYLTVPMAAAMILLREPLVRLLLSSEFLPAVPFFPYQAGGILFRALGLALGIGLLARGPVGAWLVLGLSAPILFLASFWLLAPAKGVLAAPMAYLISGAVYLLVSFFLTRRYLSLALPPAEFRRLASAAVLLGLLVWVAGDAWWSSAIGIALTLAWYGWSLSLSELRQAWGLVSQSLTRKNGSE